MPDISKLCRNAFQWNSPCWITGCYRAALHSCIPGLRLKWSKPGPLKVQMELFKSCAHNERSRSSHCDSVICGLCNDMQGAGNIFRLASRVRRGDYGTMTGRAIRLQVLPCLLQPHLTSRGLRPKDTEKVCSNTYFVKHQKSTEPNFNAFKHHSSPCVFPARSISWMFQIPNK